MGRSGHRTASLPLGDGAAAAGLPPARAGRCAPHACRRNRAEVTYAPNGPVRRA
jgi:hypothetical protein